jgi:hypothetical protein
LIKEIKMAQQIINVGTATNDGTGDNLRTGAIKINENFTELYSLPSIPTQTNQGGKFLSTNGSTLVWTTNNNTGATLPDVLNNSGKFLTTDGSSTSWSTINYNSLTNKPTIPAAQVQSDWNAVSGVTQILNKPTIPAQVAQVQSDWNAVSGLGVILNKPTIPAAQVQSDWNAVSGSALILNKPTIPAAQVQSDWNAVSGFGVILNKPTVLNIQSRTTKVATTGSISSGSSVTVTITGGFKGYALYSIQVSSAAWVVVYNGATARTTDASRLITTDPTPDAGVIAEVVTTGAQTINFSPATLGYSAENSTDIPLKVTNQAGSAQVITVTLTLLQLEA